MLSNFVCHIVFILTLFFDPLKNILVITNLFVFVAPISSHSVFQFVQMRSNVTQFSLPHSFYINFVF